MRNTQIPKDELEVFASLKDVKVVFDVGARDDVDYLILKPDIVLHAFEPEPEFFKALQENIKHKTCFLNNFACGNKEITLKYDQGGQRVLEELKEGPDVQVKRLDKYIDDNNVTQIDFLKIDVEGYETKVIEGLGDKISICRYIQYEQGTASKDGFERLLTEDFDLYYIGYRNVIGVRKGEEMPFIPDPAKEGGVPEKNASNYL